MSEYPFMMYEYLTNWTLHCIAIYFIMVTFFPNCVSSRLKTAWNYAVVCKSTAIVLVFCFGIAWVFPWKEYQHTYAVWDQILHHPITFLIIAFETYANGNVFDSADVSYWGEMPEIEKSCNFLTSLTFKNFVHSYNFIASLIYLVIMTAFTYAYERAPYVVLDVRNMSGLLVIPAVFFEFLMMALMYYCNNKTKNNRAA